MAGELLPSHDSFLLVGGPAHGEIVTIKATATTWVHVGSASTYRREKFGTYKRGPLGVPSKVYEREFLLHESIRDPNRAQLLLQLAALHRWFMGGRARNLTEQERELYREQQAGRDGVARARLNGGTPRPDPTGLLIMPGNE